MARPLKYDTPEKLQTAVDLYFDKEEKPTLAGLAYELGINRQTLYNYENKDQFLDIIKKARERVEASYEGRLIYGSNPTGVIFALKNMGWKDKQEVDNRYPDGVILNFEKVPSLNGTHAATNGQNN